VKERVRDGRVATRWHPHRLGGGGLHAPAEHTEPINADHRRSADTGKTAAEEKIARCAGGGGWWTGAQGVDRQRFERFEPAVRMTREAWDRTDLN